MDTPKGVVWVVVHGCTGSSGAWHCSGLGYTPSRGLVDQVAAGVMHVRRLPVCCSACYWIIDSLQGPSLLAFFPNTNSLITASIASMHHSVVSQQLLLKLWQGLRAFCTVFDAPVHAILNKPGCLHWLPHVTSTADGPVAYFTC